MGTTQQVDQVKIEKRPFSGDAVGAIFFTILGIGGLALSVVALIWGIYAIDKIKKRNLRGGWLAWAAVVITGLRIILGIIFMFLV
ncbi:MAG TPA: hypothetical protein VJA27_03100 [Patescibacteria group bacterium]|nr:hypothetical protein [Patescibacteria group bacterium]